MKLPLDSPRSDHSRPIHALSQSRQGDMACDTLYVCKHVQGEKRVRLMLLLKGLRGAFHLRSGSCCGHDFADSPSNQLGTVKMDPVSAVARYQVSPARRELRQVALPIGVWRRMVVSRKHDQRQIPERAHRRRLYSTDRQRGNVLS